jgi:hypothetical protein
MCRETYPSPLAKLFPDTQRNQHEVNGEFDFTTRGGHNQVQRQMQGMMDDAETKVKVLAFPKTKAEFEEILNSKEPLLLTSNTPGQPAMYLKNETAFLQKAIRHDVNKEQCEGNLHEGNIVSLSPLHLDDGEELSKYRSIGFTCVFSFVAGTKGHCVVPTIVSSSVGRDCTIESEPMVLVTTSNANWGCFTHVHMDYGLSRGLVSIQRGEKLWALWRFKKGCNWPTNGHKNNPDVWEKCWMVVHTKPGDTLYLPEGVVHCVWTRSPLGAIQVSINLRPSDGGLFSLFLLTEKMGVLLKNNSLLCKEVEDMIQKYHKGALLSETSRGITVQNGGSVCHKLAHYRRLLVNYRFQNMAECKKILDASPVTADRTQYRNELYRKVNSGGRVQNSAQTAFTHKKRKK